MPTANFFAKLSSLLKGFWSLPDLSYYHIKAIFYRHLLVFKKTWLSNIMFNFIEPVLYLWAMGIGLGTYVALENGIPYIQFIGPALTASSAMFATCYEATYGSFTRMGPQKVFHSMAATPASAEDVVMGEIVYGVFKGTLYGLVFLLVVAMFGLVKSPWVLMVPLPLILMTGVFANLSLVWTSLAPNYDSYNYFFTLVISPMFLVCGVFFPLESLPPVFRTLAWFAPLYHAVEVVRPLVLGSVKPSCWYHLAWMFFCFVFTLRFPLIMLKNRLVN
ncbi:MAG TPA: ABC transporter permease [Syntrophothermus lipocalidus]|uniref:Transport permease protein n=1 Tax=Syntrophothermus lipocalidus (strain DSM 12680 / TGB-C1) TaxID=643648 RepID=D7CIG2_SYNLT|nr:ABC transporter permease [Syntrophothermus lipocalidus]ADI00827.1 ABC-2 type transporter [Syntrophothermus lipocalidus DSM 12680]HHV76587.1 ABC transporter permease [Syntrophothermus lipocalidus]